MTVWAVVFELEGALMSTGEARAAAWSDACLDYGFERDLDLFLTRATLNDNHIHIISPHLSDDSALYKAIEKRQRKLFLERYMSHVELTRGARDLLIHLHQIGYLCVASTSLSAQELEVLLRMLRINHLISVASTLTDEEHNKLDESVGPTLQDVGAWVGDAIFIGATPHDIEKATKAGIETIALRCAGWDDEGLCRAIEIYDDPADLLANYHLSALAR